MQPPTASPETLLISHRQRCRAECKDAFSLQTYMFTNITNPGDALFTGQITETEDCTLVKKWGWKSCEFTDKRSLDVAKRGTASLTTHQQLHSPQRHPRVSMSTHLCGTTHNNAATGAKRSWWWARLWAVHTEQKQEADRFLPVDDHGVWGGFVSVSTAFFVTTPTVMLGREEQTGKKRYEGISQQADCRCLASWCARFYASDTLSPRFSS